MNTNELRCMLTKDPVTRAYLRNVYALDQFEEFVRENSLIEGLYVINDQPIHKLGRHWLLVLVESENKKIVFFDSFGRPPDYYNLLRLLIQSKTNTKRRKAVSGIELNSIQLQSLYSNVCGGYVVFFATQLCRGEMLKDIVKRFDKTNFQKNDEMIIHFIRKYFPGHGNF